MLQLVDSMLKMSGTYFATIISSVFQYFLVDIVFGVKIKILAFRDKIFHLLSGGNWSLDFSECWKMSLHL